MAKWKQEDVYISYNLLNENRKTRLSALPNGSPYIHVVKISGFTRSISRLRANVPIVLPKSLNIRNKYSVCIKKIYDRLWLHCLGDVMTLLDKNLRSTYAHQGNFLARNLVSGL
jgi:hypothetical protein